MSRGVQAAASSWSEPSARDAARAARANTPACSPWRGDFPALRHRDEDGAVYLDSASMTLKPTAVIDAVCDVYRHGAHADVEGARETARAKVAALVGARPADIVFTHNCSGALHLVALGLGLSYGDEIIVSRLEHQSNVQPWRRRAQLRMCEIGADGRLDLDHLESLLSSRTRVVALTLASNVTGVVQPVADAVALARARGALTVVDAAQAPAHRRIDVDALGCDFLALSGAKMFGPSGVGVLYGRAGALAQLEQGGDLETGMPNVEGVIGLAGAIDYLAVGGDALRAHTDALGQYLRRRLREQDWLALPFASADDALPIACVAPRTSTLDAARLAAVLASDHGITVRAGTHGCQPLFDHARVPAAARVSLAAYNDRADVDALIDALQRMRAVLS